MMKWARPWFLAVRPKTLSAAVIPVLVGSACAFAGGSFYLPAALAAALGAIFIQIGTNLANDVFDYEKGADTSRRLGPTRVVSAGLLSPQAVRAAMVLTFGVAALIGLYLVKVGGPWVVPIGLSSIAAGVLYTAGPFPLAYHGLGDLFVFLFFGFVAVCGTTYVSGHSLSPLAIWASIPIGALSTAILAVNNLRDVQEDTLTNKRTLAVRFGPKAAIAEYMCLVLLSYLVPLILYAIHLTNTWIFLPLVSLPFAGFLLVRICLDAPASLNPLLGKTSALLLLYGLLFSVGLFFQAT